MKIYRSLLLLTFALAFACAQKANASIIVFEDDFNYTGWSGGANPMNAVWTGNFVGNPSIGDGTTTAGFPNSYLALNNRGVYVDLPDALTTDWILSVTMISSAYGRLNWFGLTDGTGQNGYYVGWDTGNIDQFGGQGRVAIGKMTNKTVTNQSNPGTWLKPLVTSGAIAGSNNTGFSSFASVTLIWTAETKTLELRVNDVLKQTVVDVTDPVTSFSRIYLAGNTSGYYGDVVLATIPQPASVAITLIQNAVAAHAEEVVLPRAIYRFQGNERLTLSQLENFRIDGSGSTFLFDRGGKFTVNECRDLTVENIKIDYDPLPFTQGVVVGMDAAAKNVRVRFDKGFHAPGSSGFPLTVKADGTTSGSLRFLDTSGERMHAMLWEGVTSVRAQPPGGDIYEIGLLHGRLFGPWIRPDSLKIGDRFTLFKDQSEALDVSRSERVIFRNVDIYSSPGFGIGEKWGKGGNVYENCRLIRKPGSGRLMVTNRDGFHSYMVEKGPLLKECEVSYTADDAVAIHGFFSPVIEILDAKTVYLVCPLGLNTNEGDSLSFYSLKGGSPLGSRTMLRVTKLSSAAGQVKLDAWKAALANAGLQGGMRTIPDGQWAVAEIELDADIELSDFALAASGAFSGAGAEIRNCHIHDTTSRGLLIRSPASKIIGNRIERTALAPISLMPERYWLEGPFLDQIELRGNTIIDAPMPALDKRHFDAGFAAIQVASVFGRRFTPPEFHPHRQNRGIRIVNNDIIRPAWTAIAVLNAEDVVISENRIESPFAAGITGNPLNLLNTLTPSGPTPTPAQSTVAANPWYGILLMAAGNAEVTGNTLVNAGQGVLGPVGVGPWTEDVRVQAVVFNDDFIYTGWNTGIDPMNTRWTRVVNMPTLQNGSGAWPVSYLRLNNSTIFTGLDEEITQDFSLTVTMFSESYARSHWFAITDSAGSSGYYIRWDGGAPNQYNGQGRIQIGKISTAITGYQTNPGFGLTTLGPSGHEAAAGDNSIPFATITLKWATSSGTLELWVNGTKKQEVVDASFSSFSRIYLSGNANGLYGSVSLSTVP